MNFTRHPDRVAMLSLMLFLDCSSDHWKYESLLVCYCKPYGENSCIFVVTTSVDDPNLPRRKLPVASNLRTAVFTIGLAVAHK